MGVKTPSSTQKPGFRYADECRSSPVKDCRQGNPECAAPVHIPWRPRCVWRRSCRRPSRQTRYRRTNQSVGRTFSDADRSDRHRRDARGVRRRHRGAGAKLLTRVQPQLVVAPAPRGADVVGLLDAHGAHTAIGEAQSHGYTRQARADHNDSHPKWHDVTSLTAVSRQQSGPRRLTVHAQPGGVLPWRHAEHPPVFTVELRRAVVADAMPDACDVAGS